MHPADETTISKVRNVYFPALAAGLVVFASLCVDIFAPNDIFWFQRAGAIMAASGVYITFHESMQFFKVIGDDGGNHSTYFNPEIKYKWLALAYAILGTIIWGYGDIPFKFV